VKVLEVIKRSAEFLAKKGVDSPRLQVELLLAHRLRVPRMKLYLDFERQLAPGELEDLREMLQRRGRREPLQHIIGSTSFCGLEMAVNPQVLVPRPETELLGELGWKFLNAELGMRNAECGENSAKTKLRIESPNRAPPPQPSPPMGEREKNVPPTVHGEGSRNGEGKPSALDFGTGSGCLAIALAVKCSMAEVIAVDISAEALAVAQRNAATHEVESRIRFLGGDGFKALPAEQRFDLIVSNPPYIPSADIATLQPEVRHDPRLALDGGADGLDFYRRLALEAGPFLKPGGRMMLELGDGQAGAATDIFTQQKWIVEAVKDDYNGTPRILIVFKGKTK
jgi:release factor glutamine methyltransferase